MRYRVGSEEKKLLFFAPILKKTMNISKIESIVERYITSDEKNNLIYNFCSYLNNRTNSLKEYYYIVYAEEDNKEYIYNQGTTWLEDISYIKQYQKKHDCYPAKFQELFNEWLLTRL